MTNEVKVDWPKTVALVVKREMVPGRVLEDPKLKDSKETVAYELGFSKEEIIWQKAEISPKETPQDIPGFSHVYKCPIHAAYYLARVVVRPLDGKMLPKGIVHVHLDGELILEGRISEFLPDLDPVDCLKPYPWKKSERNFPACPMRDDGGVEGAHQIGFMMPNLAKVEVWLGEVTTEEKMTLEVGVIAAFYSTKKSEITV